MSFKQQQMSSFEQPREGSAPSPCLKGCGFFGSPGTQNMCSVCFKKHLVATGEPEAATSASKASVAPYAAKATGDATEASALTGAETAVEEALRAAELKQKAWVERCRAEVAKNYWENRCPHCNKKMTLVGRFQCRCGKTYCPTHRHPEEHACTYDYQSAGRIAIRRSNPLVEGEKLQDRI